MPSLCLVEKGFNPLSFSTTGKLYISFGYCKRGSFYDPSKRQEWLNRLNQIPGLHLPPDSVDKYPGVSLAFLSSENRVAEFLKVMDCVGIELGPDRLSSFRLLNLGIAQSRR
jgi:hypothetical protein